MLCVADSWGSEAVNEEPMSLFRQVRDPCMAFFSPLSFTYSEPSRIQDRADTVSCFWRGFGRSGSGVM